MRNTNVLANASVSYAYSEIIDTLPHPYRIAWGGTYIFVHIIFPLSICLKKGLLLNNGTFYFSKPGEPENRLKLPRIEPYIVLYNSPAPVYDVTPNLLRFQQNSHIFILFREALMPRKRKTLSPSIPSSAKPSTQPSTTMNDISGHLLIIQTLSHELPIFELISLVGILEAAKNNVLNLINSPPSTKQKPKQTS